MFQNTLMVKSISTPMPSNISYFWNFGSLLGICWIIQVISGVFLTFYFKNDISLAFDSTNYIMRDINSGWFLRSLHANGASLFFSLVYFHVWRGLFYFSFLLKKVWFSGVVIFLILMMTAFVGYVLPWGQMSYWGATVITNLLTALPYVGKTLTFWIWGGFSVNNATLSRFFSIHFILPVVLLILIMLHLMFLHNKGSSNPLGSNSNLDKISFFPFFLWKDLFGLIVFLSFFSFVVFMSPFIFMDADNFSQANPLSTPPHIQPEWYFLFAYAVLRAIPNKLGGVLALVLSVLILMVPSFNNQNFLFASCKNKHSIKIFYWWAMFNFMFLTFLGGQPVEAPFVEISYYVSGFYFSFFTYLMFIKKMKLKK